MNGPGSIERRMAAHRPIATQLGDVGGAILSHRAWALWLLGDPEAAFADADHAIGNARKIGHAATLMVALGYALPTCIYRGNYEAANAQAGWVVSP